MKQKLFGGLFGGFRKHQGDADKAIKRYGAKIAVFRGRSNQPILVISTSAVLVCDLTKQDRTDQSTLCKERLPRMRKGDLRLEEEGRIAEIAFFESANKILTPNFFSPRPSVRPSIEVAKRLKSHAS